MNAVAQAPGEIILREQTALSKSVLKTLLYYDLFNHPLTADELLFHCSEVDCNKQLIQSKLDELYNEGLIYRWEKFYSIQNKPEIFLRRIKGNEAAANAMKKAASRSKLIAAFPYVRCVCISGSLSKNYFDSTTDVDFFIITKPNRLWICRTLLILFKKFFLFNSKKYFCVNYFIDAENLVIQDKNIFTATELITLKPMYNDDLYQKLFNSNQWVKSFFPNGNYQSSTEILPIRETLLKKWSEKLLNGNFGEWLDQFFMKRTLQHWKKKFGWQPSAEFELNMRSRRNVSKHHPQGFQFQVLKRYNERVRLFEEEHEIILADKTPSVVENPDGGFMFNGIK